MEVNKVFAHLPINFVDEIIKICVYPFIGRRVSMNLISKLRTSMFLNI